VLGDEITETQTFIQFADRNQTISVLPALNSDTLSHGEVRMRRFGPLLATVSAFLQPVTPFTTVMTTAIAAQTSAQIVQLTATKTRVTYSIGPAGGYTLKLEERGAFSRNSGGDEATHLKVIRDGQLASGSSVINQRKERISYVIDDARQQYRLVPWSGSPALTNEAERQSTPAATRTIDGVKCVSVPVRDSTGKIVGKGWVSPDYGITVRSEIDELSSQTGAVIGLMVEELTEIQIGATPDPAAFIIPPGYKEVEARGPR
jgi:hypothetical protein